MRSAYQRLALPFTRVFEHRFISINKSDPVVNLSINAPSKSLSKILILAVDPEDRKQFAAYGEIQKSRHHESEHWHRGNAKDQRVVR